MWKQLSVLLFRGKISRKSKFWVLCVTEWGYCLSNTLSRKRTHSWRSTWFVASLLSQLDHGGIYIENPLTHYIISICTLTNFCVEWIFVFRIKVHKKKILIIMTKSHTCVQSGSNGNLEYTRRYNIEKCGSFSWLSRVHINRTDRTGRRSQALTVPHRPSIDDQRRCGGCHHPINSITACYLYVLPYARGRLQVSLGIVDVIGMQVNPVIVKLQSMIVS